MAGTVSSFSAEYQGAYSVGGFMKAHLNATAATGGWDALNDPSGHMPRVPHGGCTDFIRILIPIPSGAQGGPPARVNLVAEYQGTGGAEIWSARTGVTGPSGGLQWPRFQLLAGATMTDYTFYVEYGRVHSVPR